MSERNKVLARRAIEEVWGQGNYALVEDLYADNYAGHQPPEEHHGLEGVKHYFTMLREAFPDIRFTVEDQIAEGDRVVTRWSSSATHTGEFMGIAPTGRSGVVTGITINRCANGEIVEAWTNLDALGLMQQLGAISTPDPVAH